MYIFRVIKWEVFQEQFYHTLKYDSCPKKKKITIQLLELQTEIAVSFIKFFLKKLTNYYA